MATDEELLLQILGQATTPLFPSEITDRLNDERGEQVAHSMTEIVLLLKGLGKRVVQLPDKRWILNRRQFER